MVRLRHLTVAFLAVVAVLAVTTVLAGNPVYRHSGAVVAVDPQAGTIVLAEVGPWKVENGRTVLTERRIAVTDATEFVIVQRTDDSPSGFPGDFTEEPLVDWDLLAGDYVTVDCEHRGTQMIALKITVVTPAAQ